MTRPRPTTNGQMESSDDLEGVGCCAAAEGVGDATGLGGPYLVETAQHLPPPSR